jgi:hypothetical protein
MVGDEVELFTIHPVCAKRWLQFGMDLDVLLFGAHPDDVEWGAGGTALLMKQQGLRFAFVDLTAGEMGSRGTPEERNVEAKAAADCQRHPPLQTARGDGSLLGRQASGSCGSGSDGAQFGAVLHAAQAG